MIDRPPQISDLTLEKVVFEIRYPQALLLWDRHGRIWESIRSKNPVTRLVHAEPGRTVFLVNNAFETVVELEQARSIVHPSSGSFDNFSEFCVLFFESVMDILEVNSLLRIGTRLRYVKKYESREQASKAILNTGLITIPDSPQFGVDGALLDPSYGIRYQNDSKGASLRLYVEEKNVDFQPPLGVDGPPPYSSNDIHLVFDVDFYSVAAVDRGQFNAKEWLGEAARVARRDADKFLRR